MEHIGNGKSDILNMGKSDIFMRQDGSLALLRFLKLLIINRGDFGDLRAEGRFCYFSYFV